MTFLRNLWQDLVDKRLWPLAVGLAVAAVAVPVVLKKPAPHASTVAAARQPAGPTPLPGTPVSLDSSGFRDALSGVPLKDPFRQQHIPRPPKTVVAQVSSTSNSSSGGSTSSGNTGAGSTGSSSGGSTHTTHTGTTKLKLRFGKAGSDLKTYALAPLTALPSSSDPVLIYLGLLKDGKTAAFLVSSDGTPQGDGRCVPSSTVCQTLLMKAGDTEFLDLDTETGAAQYELDVEKIVHS